jgi:pimeloyl-ACP methyl ester carboxylesterase
MKVQLNSLVYDKEKVGNFWIEKYFEPLNYSENKFNSLKWFNSFMFGEDINLLQQNKDNFKDVQNQVFVIWGDRDKITPPEQGEILNDLFKNSKLIILENVGHMPMIEDEENFIKILNDILEK